MPNELDSEVLHLGKHIGKKLLDSSNEPFDAEKPQASGDFKLFLVFAAFLSIVGEESIKVLFRKSFGLNGLSLYKLIINVAAFTGISLILFYLSFSNDSFAVNTGSSDAHFVYGILYFALACTTLTMGLSHRKQAKKTNNLSTYTGDSYLLRTLAKDNWSEQQIQYFFEPVLVLAIGAFTTMFDRVAGIPIICCAVSIWISIIVRKQMFGDTLKQTITKINSTQSGSFNEVS